MPSTTPENAPSNGRRLVRAGPVETVVAVSAVAAVALHVLDDNFIQPEPGVAAAGHLLSGLVPLTALVWLAARYARSGPGARATGALLAGMLGVVAGSGEAGYYSLHTGVTGDDFSGFAALAAGLVLFGVGATTLWRSRKTSGTVLRRSLRRALVVLLAAVSLYFVLLPLALAYVFTHSARAVVPQAALGAPHEDVSFRTNDGLTLRGWYVPSRNGAAIVVAPGRAGSRAPARMLARHGYGVLLFDRRGEGESDGDPNALGWSADRDLEAAVAFLQARPDVDRRRIGGLGLSVGGETLLQAAAESTGLRAIVSDGAGARSLREDLARPGSSKWAEIPTSVVFTAGTALFSNHWAPPNLAGLVGRIAPRPILFIYGEHDQPNVQELTPKYYAAAGGPKQIWQVEGAGHTGGIHTRPVEYERRVSEFFDAALSRRA